MTLYYDNLIQISKALIEYIEKLDSEDRQKFCNLGPSLLNNNCAKPFWAAAAICKHYIIDKNDKIFVTKLEAKKLNPDKITPKHILQINHFSDFKKLGKIISKLI